MSEELIRIAVLESLAEAQVLGAALEEQGIPHVMRSYHDSALDGLFQSQQGWGLVEAVEEFRPAILAVLEEIRRSSP